MSKIVGKIRNTIYSSSNGYTVALFKVKSTQDDEMKDFLNKTITVTGNFINANTEDLYELDGSYKEHARYGFQFVIDSFEKIMPTTSDALIEFLSSSLIKGCGEKTAKSIVEHFGQDAINIIKNTPERLKEIKNMSDAKIGKIYTSICSYTNSDEILIYLKKLGFQINECSLIFNKYGDGTKDIIENHFYKLLELIDFNKLDNIYINNFNPKSDERIMACIVQSTKLLDMKTGNTFHLISDLYDSFKDIFKLNIEFDKFNKYLKACQNNNDLVIEDDNVFSSELYKDELTIANKLLKIKDNNKSKQYKFSDISKYVSTNNITYNDDQKNAILSALNNSISIISGGPGVGKTTVINAIVQMYLGVNNISKLDALNKVALLAPTGRAAKKLSSTTNMPAQTIHRFLKWNKETDSFLINEYNQSYQTLVIVDEVSMLDTHLFSSLLRGLTTNIKLVLVGDVFQLPSVGPGQILCDLIDSNKFEYTFLNQIYRQSDNSYIPYLALDIKNKNINDNIFEKKDDYTFIETPIYNIKSTIKKICELSSAKNISQNDIQILAPMYKGENGIDNLNYMLQDFFNKKDESKNEISYSYVTYRENDKVLQQVNNPDCNVFNGDIGYIVKIKNKEKKDESDIITINFDGNIVEYKKEDLSMIKHAYAITIHKSQGSEFPHVIIPVCTSYNKMLYNKLIYTGISRAKKSLVIIGEKDSLIKSIENDYSTNRKTKLKEKLMYN